MSTVDAARSASSADELERRLAALQAELAGVKAEMAAKVSSLEDTVTDLAHENALLKRRLYGKRTERSFTSELQLSIGDLLATETKLQAELDAAAARAEQAAAAATEGKPDGEPRAKRSGHGRRNLFASKLPRYVIEIVDAEREEQGCRRIGFDDSPQLAFRPGGFYVLVKRIARYEVIEDGAATVVAPPAPATLFPKALLHTSTVAHLLTSKFALGVPHYRLEQALEEQGMSLDRGLMSRYVEHAGNTLGATIVAAMWRDAIADGHVISTDATGALIQPTKAKDGRSLGCKKGHFFTAVVDLRAVLFAYAEHHTSDTVETLFAGFGGYLQADASAVYDVLDRGPPVDTDDGVKLVGCWAHARRYFFEAAICRHPAGVQGLLRIRAIYAAERAERRMPRDERAAFRATHMRPLIDDFFTWVHAVRDTVAGRNLATKALGYALNQEAELRRVLDDVSLPLDNTRAERALRKIVVGRKNWLFYGSDTHAEAAAAIFSLIASCRLHRLDPFTYFDEVLRVLPYWPRDRYLELAPANWAATRGRLDPDELSLPIASFTVPEAPAPAPP